MHLACACDDPRHPKFLTVGIIADRNYTEYYDDITVSYVWSFSSFGLTDVVRRGKRIQTDFLENVMAYSTTYTIENTYFLNQMHVGIYQLWS